MESPVEREDSEEQLRTYRSKAEQEFKDLKVQLNKQLTESQSENSELRHTIERLTQQHRIAAEERDDKIHTLEASNALLDDRLKSLAAEHELLKAKDVEATTSIKSKDETLKYLEDALSTKDAEYNSKYKVIESTYETKLEELKAMFSNNKDENDKTYLSKIDKLQTKCAELERKYHEDVKAWESKYELDMDEVKNDIAK